MDIKNGRRLGGFFMRAMFLRTLERYPVVQCLPDEYVGLGSIDSAVMTKGTQSWYRFEMKCFRWDADKNEHLIREWNISFEEIVVNIHLGNAVAVFGHPNQARYPGQQIAVVIVEDYAFLVPFVENADGVFLKTIIPSRKATKQFLGDNDE